MKDLLKNVHCRYAIIRDGKIVFQSNDETIIERYLQVGDLYASRHVIYTPMSHNGFMIFSSQEPYFVEI